MTTRLVHVLSLIPIVILTIVLGHHPVYCLVLVVGVLLPEIDTISSTIHRSWLFHTFLLPAIIYQLLITVGMGNRLPSMIVAVHFITLGMIFHFLLDYVYPKQQSNSGAEWPVRPALFSEPWGLTWLGLSWFAQWFGYLSIAFLPWLLDQFF